ncbi:MAG: FAD-dependent oxidoreductase [Candidatus Izemoplasmatales bacterium]
MDRFQDLIAEAARCLDCKHRPCQVACPAHNDIPALMKAVKNGDFAGGKRLWDKTSKLPELCGALCQQEVLCEGACTLNKIKKPVRIGFVERGVALLFWGEAAVPTAMRDHRHLVVGMGPAGLANAIAMAEKGYRVDAVEANPRIGGAIWNLVPPFRFDASDLSSIEVKLAKLKVDVRYNFRVGRDASLTDLVDRYDSVFVAHGLDVPQLVPGFSGPDVHYAIDLLNRVVHSPADLGRLLGRRVAVVGLGSVACDTARTLAQLGRTVTVVYRRTLAEAPASPKEIAETLAEGVTIEVLLNPTSYQDGILHCERTELVHDAASPRGRIRTVPGSDVPIACDSVVFAIGQASSDALFEGTGIRLAPEVSPYATTDPKVFVGGDRVIREKRIVDAMVSGIEAAAEIERKHPCDSR